MAFRTSKCVVVNCRNGIGAIIEQIRGCKELGADVVEIRVDDYLNFVPPLPVEPEEVVPLETEDAGVHSSGDDVEADGGSGEDISAEEVSITEERAESEEVVKDIKSDEISGTEANLEKPAEEKSADVADEKTDVGTDGATKEGTVEEVEEVTAPEPVVPEPLPDPELSHIEEVFRESPLPVICKYQGIVGEEKLPLSEKVKILQELMDFGPSYIELDTVDIDGEKGFKTLMDQASSKGIKIILSSNLTGDEYTNRDIVDTVKTLSGLNGDICKCVCELSSFTTFAELFSGVPTLEKLDIKYAFEGTGKHAPRCAVFANFLKSEMAYCSYMGKDESFPRLNLKQLNREWMLMGKIK